MDVIFVSGVIPRLLGRREETIMSTTVARLSTLAACALTIFVSTEVRASTIEGKVLFVGTMSEYHPSGNDYQATIRVKLRGKCTPAGANPADQWDFWVHIRSGQMVEPYSHNGPNLINAYNTLLTALTTQKAIRIDGLGNCANVPPGGLIDNQNLWDLYVGITR
jgi:hypothetical protein